MPPHVDILNEDGTPATPIEIAISGGEESAVFTYEIWNDKLGAFVDTETAQDVRVSLLASLAGGPYVGTGVTLLDQLWTRVQITHTLTTAGESTEGATGVQPFGTNADIALSDLAPQTGVRITLQVDTPTGQSASATRIKLSVDGNRTSAPLGQMITLATGSGIVPPDRIAGLRSILRGSVITADDTDTVAVSGGQMVYDGTTVTFAGEDLVFDLNDSTATPLASGESYRVTISREDDGALVATKGPEGVVLSYPDKPAANVWVGQLTVTTADGIAVTVSQASVGQAGMLYHGFHVRAGVGLAVIVSRGSGVTSNDHRQDSSHETIVEVAASDTSYIWRLHAGGFATTLTDAEPAVGADLLAVVVTGVATVDSVDTTPRRFVHRALVEWTMELRHTAVMTGLAEPSLGLQLGFLGDDAELEAVEFNLTDVDAGWTADQIRIDVRAFPPGAAVPYPGGGAGVGGASIYTDDSQRPSLTFDAAVLRVRTEDHITRRFPRGTRFLLDVLTTVTGPGAEDPQMIAVTLHFRRYR